MSCSLMKHRSSGWKTFLAHLEVSLNEREGFFGSSPEAGSPRELAPVREAGGSLGDLVEDWRAGFLFFRFTGGRTVGGAGADSRAGQEDEAAARGGLGWLVGCHFFSMPFLLVVTGFLPVFNIIVRFHNFDSVNDVCPSSARKLNVHRMVMSTNFRPEKSGLFPLVACKMIM